MEGRRQYSDELRAEAVRMIINEGYSHTQVSRKLSIPKGTIGAWVAQFKKEGPEPLPGNPSLGEVLAENAKLRKELAEAKMREEILKKATAYFAKESLQSMRS